MPVRKNADEKADEADEERRAPFVERARAALVRGDDFFELWVGGVQQPYRESIWESRSGEVLTEITALGWHLLHVGYTRQESEYVSVYLFGKQLPRGAAAMSRLRGAANVVAPEVPPS